MQLDAITANLEQGPAKLEPPDAHADIFTKITASHSASRIMIFDAAYRHTKGFHAEGF
jgi:hypothetical protein